LSLDAIFGTHAGMKVSPPDGDKWTAAEAASLSHFVNCHGAAADPNFYGESGGHIPVAHSAAHMEQSVVEATILAAECCFSAELYDPALPTAGGQMGMCNTYLGRKAYACFGSTNLSYGPETSNDQADLMCQYFLGQVLAGASVGRACLQARLDYVLGKGGILTPTDLKTLGQFNLLADPSLVPIEAPTEKHVVPTARARDPRAATIAMARHARLARRAGLVAQARATTAHRLRNPRLARGGGKTGILAKLRKMAAGLGIKAPDVVRSYSVVPAPALGGANGLADRKAVAGPSPKAIHTVFERRKSPRKVPHLVLIKGLEAIEYADGMDVRPFVSR
jgi:hypothetical protein